MQSPIGGPRFWRRLVSRWWQPTTRMQREWEQRAQSDAFGYIGRGYAESDAKFWSSGETDLEELILRDIDLKPSASAVEIGCGVGRLVRPLSKRVAQATGVDIAPGMISRGRELLDDVPNAHLHATEGSLEILNDNSQDFVFSFVVFQHIPSKQAISRYISETARVLKPGGVFKFQVDGRERPFWKGTDTWLGIWFKPDEIKQILIESGFRLIDTWGEATQYYWLTAELVDEQNEGQSYAHASRPVWNEAALTKLLHRFSADQQDSAQSIMAGKHYLRDFAGPFLKSHSTTSDVDFIKSTFLTVLGRDADDEGLKFYTQQLAGNASRSYIIDCLLSSAELRSQLRLEANA
jgi:SAM-dependent methyltransferase